MDFLTLSWFRFGLDALRSGWRYARRNVRKLTPAEKIAARQKWKKPFEDYIYTNQRKSLRLDAFMRDVRRLDDYPDIKNKRGISPWFRFGLVDTYERGFMASLHGSKLVEDATTGKWRYTAQLKGETGKYLTLIGYVPYEFIEDVNWEGDQIYDYPHVFCYFDGLKRQPYERMMFCEPWDFDGITHFREVVDFFAVHKESGRHGTNFHGIS
ncbi:hypothetical protein [Mesorhizobium sp. LSJC264A00]|uniref:hypothetical protein n=1 Tax=unclassified Mesorhizobium TaxID=325217 RepID=UPI0003CF5C29|nr:hypothetical protein [Mesorhizobium sp. LSJC264A00]ESX24171.1 hypothetical protein X767_13175 [Mesorhizobium sp. LSJC264A00]